MYRRAIDHPDVPPTTDLSQAILVGNLLFCSGQIGIGPDGAMVSDDVEQQMHQAFQNLDRLVRRAGGTLANVVKITSFLVRPEDKAALVRVRRQYFTSPYPASTLVVVQALAAPEYLYELEAIAVLEQAGG